MSDVTMSTPSLLELEDISKYYGNIIALTGVTTSVTVSYTHLTLPTSG